MRKAMFLAGILALSAPSALSCASHYRHSWTGCAPDEICRTGAPARYIRHEQQSPGIGPVDEDATAATTDRYGGAYSRPADEPGRCPEGMHGTYPDCSDKYYSRPASTPLPTGGPVQVRGYYRKDGTYVRPHTRSTPRRRR